MQRELSLKPMRWSRDLPDASSLLSSRWTRDNLVTSHPARLYDGRILEPLDLAALEHLIRALESQRGPLNPGVCRMGVLTWDVSCANEEGQFVVQIPRALDEAGRRGRSKREVPGLNVENLRYYAAQGLKRFLVEPRELVSLEGGIVAAIISALPGYRPITFGQGALQLELSFGKQSWLVALGPQTTAELLAEMIAALVYHYEPALAGGTAVTDVCINDGDFAAKRRSDGSFEVRLTAARRREAGIGPNLLLLYLIQLMAYEDWNVDGNLVGLPVLVSNPSVAFEGVVRGLAYRYRDLGLAEEAASGEARRWIGEFGRSREGRAYRPWVDRFLEGRLPLSFGEDLRERWWRLIPLRTKLGVLELHARHQPASNEAASARTLKSFIDRLAREIGRIPPVDELTHVNELGREALSRLLEEARVEPAVRNAVVDDWYAHWPYRSLEQLLAQLPQARGLRRMRSRISFGRVVAEADQGTLRSLSPPSKEAGTTRPIANSELFGGLLDPSLHEAAVRTFPTFEQYMDSALHDEKWGYYAHAVVISTAAAGHFDTHPEELSPHYGAWIASWAFDAWRLLVASGELAEADPFPVIEFGAGNGRLARDVLDAVMRRAGDAAAPEAELWRAFAERMAYRIYEMSASLRDKQRRSLRDEAIVMEGDARHPERTLKKDFPTGVKGLVVTNEVPDAFGVHKVLLTAEGEAFVALVMPRVEAALREGLGEGSALQIANADRALRKTFGLRNDPDDFYLDGPTYAQVMTTLAGLEPGVREGLLARLWFEEAYVSAAAVPELAAHLRANAGQYAVALAAEDSGVVIYVNVHAGRFIRELGSSLTAGLILTIDYGDSTWGLVQGARRGDFPFRVYGEWQDYVPRPNDPYTAPGTQDMTADVNFSDLARTGQEAGLEVMHFGPERDVAKGELPRVQEAAREVDSFAKFVGNPVFKMLLLGRRTGELSAGPLASPLPLWCREQDVPKARREKIEGIARRLTALAPRDISQ